MEHARLPAGLERATLTGDRDDVRRRGAQSLALGGRVGAASSLLLRNHVGKPGVRPSDLELRYRKLELLGLELLADGDLVRKR